MPQHPSPDNAVRAKPHRPRTGMCSVTLRNLDPETVIQLAVEADLESIEWASDTHVVAGDLKAAAHIGDQTRDAGMAIASYGSYFRFPWSAPPGEKANDIVETALALGAPRIRIWAGPTASDKTEPTERVRTTEAIAEICRQASSAGLGTALEFHLGTLADTVDSTLRLLADLDAECVSTYWQPRIGATDSEAVEDLKRLGGNVSTLHVFSWGAKFDRHPLKAREEMWREVAREAVRMPQVTDMLLEFLPDDDETLLSSEARTLNTWLDDAIQRSTQ